MRMPSLFHRFLRGDRGSVSAFSLFLTMATLLVGGLAVDATGIMKDIVHLQAAADSSAHAALYTRDDNTVEAAKDVAIGVARSNMPHSYYGDVLERDDVVFGEWDEYNRTFTPDPGSTDAVEVTLDRAQSRGNPYRTLVLWLASLNSYDLQASAVYETYLPMCFREGFVADGPVDIQSNNSFHNGFCIHSNTYVSLNSNNFFEPGTVVSMPDLRTLQIPASGMVTNTGLDAALRRGSYNIRVLNRVNAIMNGAGDPNSRYYRPYITDPTPIALKGNRVSAADLQPGHVYVWDCGGNFGTVDSKDGVIKDVVVKVNCPTRFSEGSELNDATFLSTSTDDKAFDGPSGLQLGRDDHCAPGGGAQLVTLGGVNFAANLAMFGGQIIAVGQIDFAARANGIEGAAMVSHTGIDSTSNMDFGFCGDGMDDNYYAHYFRLVR